MKDESDNGTTVRTMRYEIVGWAGDPKDAKARWRRIADDCREIVNLIWQQWETWHIQQGSDLAARQWLADYKRHMEAGGAKKDAPKLDVVCMPPVLSKRIYAAIKDRFPHVHTRTWGLLQQLTAKRMGGKDVEGRYKIWLAVLLNRQGRPNSTHDQPIPFDSKNSRPMSRIEGKHTNYALSVNLTRLYSDKKSCPSIEDAVQLKARGSGQSILARIESGEYTFKGSSIVYHSGKRKWFALIAYQMPVAAKADVDASRTAVVHPCKDRPWRLWINGRDLWVGGQGLHVAAVRRQLLTQRWSRQENYRRAGSSNKGHGRKRALDPIFKLSNRWRQFTKCYNEQVTAEIVRRCVEQRIGRVVYLKPADDRRDSRFLVHAGKQGKNDSTGWDWAQFGSRLSDKCKAVGIHLEIRECGKRKPKQVA